MIKPVRLRKRGDIKIGSCRIDESKQLWEIAKQKYNAPVYEDQSGEAYALSTRVHRRCVGRLLTESIEYTELEDYEHLASAASQIATLIDAFQWKPSPVTVRGLDGYETLYRTPKGGVVTNLESGRTKQASIDTPDHMGLRTAGRALAVNSTKAVNGNITEGEFVAMCLKLVWIGDRQATATDLEWALQ